MDLGLRHRPIWIATSSSSLTLEIARTCLEEGALVALFGPVEGDSLRKLKLRHGPRIRVAEPPASHKRAEAVARAVRWAGAPFGVVAALPQTDDELSALVCDLQSGGAVVLFKALRSDSADTSAPWAELRDDRQMQLSALSPTIRVSVVGLAAGASMALESGDGPHEPHGLSALVTFLLGVGPGQLAHVDEAGSIHLG
jgi:hypothetical protein